VRARDQSALRLAHARDAETQGAAVGVKGPESWHNPIELAPPSSHWGFEEVNLDNDDWPPIVEVNGCAKLVLLVGLFVSPVASNDLMISA